MFDIAPAIFFSTEIISLPTHHQKDWWYYGREHGQHIVFFRLKTLEYLALKYGKYLVSNGHLCHLLSDIRVSSTVWQGLLRVKKYLPAGLKFRLKSMAWQDHILIVKRNLHL